MNTLVLAGNGALPVAPAPVADQRTDIWIGGGLIGLFLFGFIGWSAVAHLDSAVHATGVVRVAGNTQAVQSLAGGAITDIRVHEGDHVRAGQTLVEFAAPEVIAQQRALASRVIGLQAEIARIEAEQRGAGQIATPIEWVALEGAERDDAARALTSEQANLAARRALLDSQRAVLREQIAQVANQIGGYRQRLTSNRRQSELNKDELDGVQALFSKGYATKTRVLALQRSAASIDGDIGATGAEIARLQTSAGETRLQIMQLADQREHDNAERLRTAHTELETVLPQWKAAREQLAFAAARAPVSGTVIGLVANTVGGVAAAGQKLMDIVPDKGTLEVETQVALGDANDLHPGQKAEVRLAGLRGRNLPLLHGRVSRVSAQSVVDEHSGRAFFTATISVPRAELDRTSRDAGIDGSIKPGTPVDVIVPLQSRTALQYWIGPLVTRLRPALSEQ